MEFKLARSKRKTISITVVNGTVTVRAPLRLSGEAIDAFVRSKEAWIREKCAAQQARADMWAPYLQYARFLWLGETLLPLTDETARIYIADGKLHLPERCADAVGRKYIANWYKRQAQKILAERLVGIAQEYGFTVRSFRLTNARRKWGSCSGDNEIRLNWRLLFLDMSAIDYVIIHELCHTRFHDHSRRFWEEVGRYCPDYKQKKKDLQQRSVFMELFR